jgi:hypothetical protein
MTFEIIPRPTVPQQRFDAFEVGDVVVSESSMLAGIKISPTSIRLADSGVSAMVDPERLFLVPARVTVTVTL